MTDWISYRIVIPGKPIAKKRPRFFRRGNHVGTYNAQVTEEGRWMLEARDALGKAGYPDVAPAGTPIRLAVYFYFGYPASMPKKHRHEGYPHTKKPDLDNCIKFVKDCLNGIAWHDDSQVIREETEKEYSDESSTSIVIQRPATGRTGCQVCQNPGLMEAF